MASLKFCPQSLDPSSHGTGMTPYWIEPSQAFSRIATLNFSS
ncbi:hypothetical protein [Wolbachia endosymbiont (group A) of Trypoxylon clavicerum]|nr:hypothetical protein [Wolbachia endosymbiont (group A) of Trypoxylon clavicerum]